MTLDEAHQLALKILKEVMEEKVDENNIQLAQVSLTIFAAIARSDFLIPTW
jgi:20S proteasome alpha/beta subunit